MLRSREAATQLSTVSSWDHKEFVSTLVFSNKEISTDMLTLTDFCHIMKETALIESFQRRLSVKDEWCFSLHV